MKKSTYIWIGVSILALAGAAYLYFRYRRSQQLLNAPTQFTPAAGSTAYADSSFVGLNYNQVLDPDSSFTNEIKVLQLFLQKWSPTLPVTGVFDEATQTALVNVTGKPTTTLYEFRFEWVVPYFGDDVAEGIINTFTGQDSQ